MLDANVSYTIHSYGSPFTGYWNNCTSAHVVLAAGRARSQACLHMCMLILAGVAHLDGILEWRVLVSHDKCCGYRPKVFAQGLGIQLLLLVFDSATT